jgi:hypothetical protein
MKSTGIVLAALALCAAFAHAEEARKGLIVEPAPDAGKHFDAQLQSALMMLAQSKEPLLKRLYDAVQASPAAIRIRPITDDRSTWHPDGDRTRGHADPDDKRPKSAGRSKPADATLFIPPDSVDPSSSHWRSGVLVHELTHALDIANGRYSPELSVRERRATFMQNVWRNHIGSGARTSYHGRFALLDYQEAVRTSSLDEYARYIFTRADFPVPPGPGAPADKTGKED